MEILFKIDSFLVSGQIGSRRFSHRYSWWAGNAAYDIISRMHRFFWRCARNIGIRGISREFVARTRAGSTMGAPACTPMFRRPPDSPWNARRILEGFYTLESGREIPLADISWTRDPFGGVSSRERELFHSLDWVRELIEEYRASKREDYLLSARNLTGRWIGECLEHEGSENIWSDHATGRRALVLCQVWDAWRSKTDPDDPFIESLLRAIVRHAYRLAHPDFYRPEHNHGLAQAYALFAVGLMFPDHPRAGEWATAGASRLEDQMEKNVSREGIHREHSPFYHFFALRHFADAVRIGQRHGYRFSDRYRDKMNAMLNAGTWLIKPNGTLANFGDTSPESVVLLEEDDLSSFDPAAADAFRHRLSGGKSGRIADSPAKGVFLRGGGGYAVLSSGGGPAGSTPSGSYVLLRTANFLTFHLHRDLFSFEFHAFGEDLVVDSGGPFLYLRPERNYFLSTAAHNTVAVDGTDQDVAEGEIVRWARSDECALVEAVHGGYPGVRHRRLALLVPPRYLAIFDRVESEAPRTCSQFVHLGPRLEAIPDGLSIDTRNDSGGATLRILPLVRDDLALSVHRGETDPLQGWFCTGEGKMIRNTVIEYRGNGRTIDFGILLAASRGGMEAVGKVSLEGNPFRGDAVIRLEGQGEDPIDVFLPAEGDARVRRMGR